MRCDADGQAAAFFVAQGEEGCPRVVVHGHVDASRDADSVIRLNRRTQAREFLLCAEHAREMRPHDEQHTRFAEQPARIALRIPLDLPPVRVRHGLHAHFLERSAVAPARMQVLGVNVDGLVRQVVEHRRQRRAARHAVHPSAAHDPLLVRMLRDIGAYASADLRQVFTPV